ncbi:ankyrin [Schizopora paradoxa]|uniref:Ankyrin n=1 Tax=Schizopora paradoxa TaxID=27342 RepID=A0A0H2RVH9_9AGAM|nr:ankyrin [Schizopora paradoxa]
MAEKDISARLRRAVKENNVFLVKRLIQRTDLDIRNPDPGPQRYTSLAWAAVLGHVETFELLLNEGHDDDEISKDMDGNTILLLLAGAAKSVAGHYIGQYENPDSLAATLTMASMYFQRYPDRLEWSNAQGKTALHQASLTGNEGLVRMLCDNKADYDLPDNLGNTPLHYASAWNHIQIIQYLIEKGCLYNIQNQQGFTASDYAYSYSTMSVLQDTAMMQVKSKKGSKRPTRDQQYGGGVDEWIASASSSRLRSGSGGSRTTTTLDSGDIGYPQQQTSFSSSTSQQQQYFTSSNSSVGSTSRLQAPQYHSPSLSHSSSFTTASPSSHLLPSSSAQLSNSISSFNLPDDASAVLAPVASRVRERDADAIAEYKKRNRSGSAGTQFSSDSKTQEGAGTGPNGSVSMLPTINGSNSHLPLSSTTSNPPPTLATRRLLRPSASAAQLRSSPPLPIVTNVNSETQPTGTTSRVRAGTQPTASRPGQSQVQTQAPVMTSPTESLFSIAGRPSVERGSSGRRAGTVPNPSSSSIISGRRPSDPQGDFTGPPSDYAIFPDPPPKAPVGLDGTTPPPPPSATTKPASRRAGFALLTKPLPSIDSRSQRDRDHRRGGSASEVRS